MCFKSKIFFRADGNSQIGLGHVIRSLALAEMLKDEFECVFLIQNPLPRIKQQIVEVCNDILELPETSDYIEEATRIKEMFLTGDEIVVLDGYVFDTEYQIAIKERGSKLVCIDDIHAYHFVADGVINHSGGARREDYSAEPYTKFFIGLRYALLRKPFRDAARNRDCNQQASENIFVCLGGADPGNEVVSVLKKCEEIGCEKKIFLVLGAAYKHNFELKKILMKSSLNIEVLQGLTAPEMASYMKICNEAITSPSSVSLEYLSVGGILYLKLTAQNQESIYRYYLENHFAFDFRLFGSKDERIHYSEDINVLLDGRQQERIVKIFKQLSKDGKINI